MANWLSLFSFVNILFLNNLWFFCIQICTLVKN